MPVTTPRQFRFSEADLADIDRLAAAMKVYPEQKVTRTEALRYAISLALGAKKNPKTQKKTG